jgi:hypothetical protein
MARMGMAWELAQEGSKVRSHPRSTAAHVAGTASRENGDLIGIRRSRLQKAGVSASYGCGVDCPRNALL